jgi:hypothetical protein
MSSILLLHPLFSLNNVAAWTFDPGTLALQHHPNATVPPPPVALCINPALDQCLPNPPHATLVTLLSHNTPHPRRPGAMASVRALLLSCLSALALANIVASSAPVTAGERITDKLEILWGQTQLLNGDRTLSLSLDRAMGSGFRSKTSYLFARIDIDIKLVPKNSAGTVTTVYVSGPATLTIMRVNNECIVWFGAVDF